jgi:P22_AR N-terminal domain
MEEAEEYQAGTGAQEIIPVEQGVIMFYGRPIIVVRLPDDRPAVVIRSLCENMQLDRLAQVRRIQRTAPIAGDLISHVRIETDGGPQRVQVLILRSVPYWLTGIDHKRVRPEMQQEVLRYQCEAVDVLYSWAQQPRALPPAPTAELQAIESSGTSTAIEQPGPGGAILAPMEEPGPEASHAEKATYHEMMSLWHRYQADQHVQQWRSEVNARLEEQESRIEAKEAVIGLIPEILERLGPEKVNDEQQTNIRGGSG